MKRKIKKSNKTTKKLPNKPRPVNLRVEKRSHHCNPEHCHDIDPANCCFSQTRQLVKLYVAIPGVETLSKSNISASYEEKSFDLSIFDLSSANYHLKVDNLLYCIVPSKCKYSLRKDKVILELTKENARNWKTLKEIVSKDEWIQAYCEYLEDIPEFVDVDALYGFAEGMWDQLNKLQDIDFNYLKPPPRMHEIIPSLRKMPPFKGFEAATAFYKSQLKKDQFNESLYVILGGSLLEMMKFDKMSETTSRRPEYIDESSFSSSPVNDSKASTDNDLLEDVNNNETLADNKKTEGNVFYKEGKFYAALQMYLEAIKLYPDNAFFYSNASASYMMLGMYPEALSMAQKSVKVDPAFGKGYLRIGKCNIALGNTKAASKALNKAKELDGDDNEDVNAESTKLNELNDHLKDGRAADKAKNYSLAASHYDSACSLAVASSTLLFLRAECHIFCDKFLKVKGIARNLLEENLQNADAHTLLGMVAYHQDEKDEALKQLREALGIAKNHSKAKPMLDLVLEMYEKKEKGNEAFKKKNYSLALKFYSTGLQLDPNNKMLTSRLHYNVACVMIKMNESEQALRALTVAISIKKDYVNAYLKRATLYQERNDHTQAIQDIKEVVKISPTDEHKKLLSKAQELFKRYKQSSRKDYYKILNVSPDATAEEIKAAYKRMALLHHPDKHEGKKEKMTNEKIFKDISEAYGVLKDSRRRSRYDNDESDFDEDSDGEDEEDLFKIFLFSQLIRNHPNFSFEPFFNGEEEYCSDDDYDEYYDDDIDSDDDDYYYTSDSEDYSYAPEVSL